ncbi:MAG: transporter substrate-binding domain-containing protein, partial [Coriobacteriales bacterium]|nr:transporter substrate-binding domain-containing protein [Coriobacteriales bacterium]
MVPLTGCMLDKKGELTLKDPVVTTPAIKNEGLLRVGVDTSATNVPFAGYSGSYFGIDVDLANALGEQLGLKVEFASIDGKDPVEMLSTQEVDLIMGLNTDSAGASSLTNIGPYMQNGTAIFCVDTGDLPDPFDPNSLDGQKIAAQNESLSAWDVNNRFGQSHVQTFSTVEEAFDAVNSGSVTYVAADAAVGAYLSAKYPGIVCRGFLDEPDSRFIGVANKNDQLSDAVV